MALLERVMTLLRANVNDLIDRAEDPDKLLKQLVLDMENQLLQVKTQVAIAIADQHLLEKKKEGHQLQANEWNRKAALAVTRDRDDLAKHALARSLTEVRSIEAFTQQLDDQRAQAETLRANYLKLQQKLVETKTRSETLRAMEKRGRVISKAQQATVPLSQGALDRYEGRVLKQSAMNRARGVLDSPDLDVSLADMERDEQVTLLLEQLKSQRALGA